MIAVILGVNTELGTVKLIKLIDTNLDCAQAIMRREEKERLEMKVR